MNTERTFMSKISAYFRAQNIEFSVRRIFIDGLGGMAYGLDRMVMLMLKKESIRDVIAFPKVQNAGEPMSGAPDIVDPQQLKDLSIALTLTE